MTRKPKNLMSEALKKELRKMRMQMGKTMKPFFIILFTIALAFILTGCKWGGGNNFFEGGY